VLAAQYPDTPEMKAAAEVALGDADASVRLLGATLVRGERGKAVLRGLLAEKLDEALLVQAVRTAAATGDASFCDAVLALAPRTEPALAEAVANALGKIGDAKMESALLRLLNRPDLAVKRAAAAALGLVGTVRAVEPLLFEEQGELGHSARDAVRRIQARLVDADAGRVSLAPQQSGSGALSIAPEGGELSEAPLHGKISS
jgi:HEAT repeat protein